MGTIPLRVVRSTERLLQILDKHRVKATFFVLGWVAERVPDLVRTISSEGHEIASHGYSHQLLTAMTPEQFEEDLQRALAVTQPCTTEPIRGFRAPSFTVTTKTLWAYDVLERLGFQYDSSVFPIGFHPDYGIADSPLTIYRRGRIIEVPMSCAVIAERRIPCSGGGYFRLYPYRVSEWLITQCNRQGRPVIFYIHPWEIDYEQPRVKIPTTKAFRHYVNLDKTEQRLERLLASIEFGPLKTLLSNRSAENRMTTLPE